MIRHPESPVPTGRSASVLVVAAVATACTAGEATKEPLPPPSSPPLVVAGWPGPLRPHLVPRTDLTVQLRPQPTAAARDTRCRLPEDRPVQWARSRLVVSRLGRLAVTASTAVDAIRLPGLARVTGTNVQDSRMVRLDLEAGPPLELLARVGGRCVIDPTGDRGQRVVWSVPCPTRKIQVAVPPEQEWFLEIACEKGEGWYLVDPEAYDIEHYPAEPPRPD